MRAGAEDADRTPADRRRMGGAAARVTKPTCALLAIAAVAAGGAGPALAKNAAPTSPPVGTVYRDAITKPFEVKTATPTQALYFKVPSHASYLAQASIELTAPVTTTITCDLESVGRTRRTSVTVPAGGRETLSLLAAGHAAHSEISTQLLVSTCWVAGAPANDPTGVDYYTVVHASMTATVVKRVTRADGVRRAG